MPFTRIAGLAGLVFILVVITANVVLNIPGAPPAVATVIAPLAWVALVVFSAGAVVTLLPLEWRRREAWSLVGFGGPILQNALFGGVVATQAALLAGGTSDVQILHDAYFGINGTALAITLVFFSLAGWRTGVLARWHSLLGLVAGVLLLISALGTPASMALSALGGVIDILGLVGFIGWLVWLPAFSIVLLRRRAEAETA